MKRNLILLTGIVFLITALAAGSCGSPAPPPPDKPKKVKIYLKAVERDGEMHLEMYDSNDTTTKVVDTLHTDVYPGTKVIWKRAKNSGIKKIEKIGPITPGPIIDKDAEKIPFTSNFGLEIPDSAPIPSESEKYIIKFQDKQDGTWTIDPFLEIPGDR